MRNKKNMTKILAIILLVVGFFWIGPIRITAASQTCGTAAPAQGGMGLRTSGRILAGWGLAIKRNAPATVVVGTSPDLVGQPTLTTAKYEIHASLVVIWCQQNGKGGVNHHIVGNLRGAVWASVKDIHEYLNSALEVTDHGGEELQTSLSVPDDSGSARLLYPVNRARGRDRNRSCVLIARGSAP
ncbi:MAG: hypothetical protein NkDv07_0297 [Candidatus Improbicoccus devescovinae]|nr:MAG: hypothetical protein NkDv07_0297 [Candidatus Improbicoccus devescovinae]